MQKLMNRLRTSILLAGLMLIGTINIKPHMPFYGFRDFDFGFEQETRSTAEVTITKAMEPQTSIPVFEVKGKERIPTGVFVEVLTDSSDRRMKEVVGVDRSSTPTLRVLGFTALLFLAFFPIEWIIGFIKRRRASRPA